MEGCAGEKGREAEREEGRVRMVSSMRRQSLPTRSKDTRRDGADSQRVWALSCAVDTTQEGVVRKDGEL